MRTLSSWLKVTGCDLIEQTRKIPTLLLSSGLFMFQDASKAAKPDFHQRHSLYC